MKSYYINAVGEKIEIKDGTEIPLSFESHLDDDGNLIYVLVACPLIITHLSEQNK
jgi:hypothetical protein